MKKFLPVRKKIRLQHYDYATENIYFITICIKNRTQLLGKIIKDNIELSRKGLIVQYNISKMEQLYNNIIIDEYVIMPNHIHLLVWIRYKQNVTLSKIIKHFKTNISKDIGLSIWQKSFYEHIIRTNNEYLRIKEYIRNNIINWAKDKYF